MFLLLSDAAAVAVNRVRDPEEAGKKLKRRKKRRREKMGKKSREDGGDAAAEQEEDLEADVLQVRPAFPVFVCNLTWVGFE